jgi:hypothetical protein
VAKKNKQVFRKIIGQLDKVTEIIVPALSTVLAAQKTRIFERGKAADGTPIAASYSERYKEFKRSKGFNVSVINLQLTGSLFADYRLLVLKKGKRYAFGVQNRINALKIKGNEGRYNKKIFEISSNEEKVLIRTINERIKRVISR